ncbi:helix-turn-helix transcriptional regulator [Vibrio sp. 404]|uniref:Helix-turn-helix transcriptional regulator n=1 Tax=Vibrio marinisediminis TaxID=2758441 RepID=A0A7W2FNE4_9VIBR|nr:helix-turn-helix transcriptional regulator [Vibrio marinisediminis]MBA5761172.1 helix-turn-helix transcriptional regulator [Vibrio marinisediminis]
MKSVVIDVWQSHSTQPRTAWVMPDGCQDVIVTFSDNALPNIEISPLHTCATPVQLIPNQHMLGLRLAAGFDTHSLNLEQLYRYVDDTSELVATIESSAKQETSQVQEVLTCFQAEPLSIQSTALTLGVSSRTLQRLLKSQTSYSPMFWLRLARVRSAAKMILAKQPLGQVAYHCHYSDQAHMSREIKHWLGTTPTQLHHRSDIANQLLAPGY